MFFVKLDVSSILTGRTKKLDFTYEININSRDSDNNDNKKGDSIDICESAVFAELPVGVTVTSPVRVNVTVNDLGVCFNVHAYAEVDYKTYCDRCAEEVHGSHSASIERIVVADKLSTNDEDDSISPDSDDYTRIVLIDTYIDIDADIIEELALMFPTSILCREDCAGICPGCSVNLNEQPCRCVEEKELDPRFAVLAKLLKPDSD
mgnify:CR=1 FL=1